jgi:YfiR/HmsC-like
VKFALLPVRSRLTIVSAILLATLLYAASSSLSVAQSKPSGEYEVKAAFLYNFAKFIDWPPGSFAGPQSPFTICILGVDPFGREMDNVLQGKMVGTRPVAIERVRKFTDLRRCQMAFVSSSDAPHLPEILESLKGSSVLVVGESEGFATAGGAIQFQIEEERVRFLINPYATENAGVKVSSKLLALAKIVRPGQEGGKD